MMARLASRGLRQTRGRGSRRGLFPGFGGAGARGFLPAAADFDGVLNIRERSCGWEVGMGVCGVHAGVCVEPFHVGLGRSA
jgi:hypothetical protein